MPGHAKQAVAALVTSQDGQVSTIVGGAVVIAVEDQRPVLVTASHCLDNRGASHVAVGVDRIQRGASVAKMFPLMRRLEFGVAGRQKNGDLAIFRPLGLSDLSDPPPLHAIGIAPHGPAAADDLTLYVWRSEADAYTLQRTHPVRIVPDAALKEARERFGRGRRNLVRIKGFGIDTGALVITDGDSGGIVISGDGSDTPNLHGVVSAKTGTQIAAISAVPPTIGSCSSMETVCLESIGIGEPSQVIELQEALMRGRIWQMEQRLELMEEVFNERLDALSALGGDVKVDVRRRDR